MKLNYFKMTITIIAVCFILLAMLVLIWKRPVGNYSDPKGPFFQGEYAVTEESFNGSLRMVTWNLHHAEDLVEIMATLKSASELRDADLFLFQELDNESAVEIAKKFNLNYVYSPSVFDRRHQKEYGNAILTQWPIHDSGKIVLPNWLPGWVETRSAVKTIISVGDRDIIVYSVHMDVLWMESQGKYLAGEIENENVPTILGGDFNTWRPSSIVSLEKSMNQAGMERLTRGTGYTFEVNGLQFTLDHIFTKKGLDFTSGVYRQTNASDHYPVWAKIELIQSK
jgi:endonuclease/exonuclease/phosphatase family metal-dependent hydrolase